MVNSFPIKWHKPICSLPRSFALLKDVLAKLMSIARWNRHVLVALNFVSCDWWFQPAKAPREMLVIGCFLDVFGCVIFKLRLLEQHGTQVNSMATTLAEFHSVPHRKSETMERFLGVSVARHESQDYFSTGHGMHSTGYSAKTICDVTESLKWNWGFDMTWEEGMLLCFLGSSVVWACTHRCMESQSIAQVMGYPKLSKYVDL